LQAFSLFKGPDQSAFYFKPVLADAALGEPCIFNYSENETNFASIFFFRMCGLTVDQPLYSDDPIDLLFAVQTIITQKALPTGSAPHRIGLTETLLRVVGGPKVAQR
jgi:hypothetical protein